MISVSLKEKQFGDCSLFILPASLIVSHLILRPSNKTPLSLPEYRNYYKITTHYPLHQNSLNARDTALLSHVVRLQPTANILQEVRRTWQYNTRNPADNIRETTLHSRFCSLVTNMHLSRIRRRGADRRRQRRRDARPTDRPPTARRFNEIGN